MLDKAAHPAIEVRDLRKEYITGDERVVALKRINLTIMQGEICCIFGTSGSGKSTLLNQLAGMEKPTRGEVRIGGASVSRMSEDELAAFRQRYIGFVFQSYNLLPNMTALENVAMPLMFRGIDQTVRDGAANDADGARGRHRLLRHCDHDFHRHRHEGIPAGAAGADGRFEHHHGVSVRERPIQQEAESGGRSENETVSRGDCCIA